MKKNKYGSSLTNHDDFKMEYDSRQKKHYARNKTKQENARLIRIYSITLDQYKEMLIKQDYKCAICGKLTSDEEKLHVDHKGNDVRGLLCGCCNRMIGLAKDNTGILQSAIDYFKRSECSLRSK